jgi:hypothetical protein
MDTAKIKELAKELWKNEEVAIELANEIFELRDSESERFKIPDDFMLKDEDLELSMLRSTRINRLTMLASYLGGLKEFAEGEENWHILLQNGEYKPGCAETWYEPEKVYMTREAVKKVCELLNSGKYSL